MDVQKFWKIDSISFKSNHNICMCSKAKYDAKISNITALQISKTPFNPLVSFKH